MKNKLKIIMLWVLCAVCLQAPMTAFAVELPFVPVDESETVGEVCECVSVAISCWYCVPLGTYTCKTAELFVRDIESDEET